MRCVTLLRARKLTKRRAILIHVATIGYGRAPEFPSRAPAQYLMEERIRYALKHKEVFREAMKKENIDPDSIPDALDTPLAARSRL